MTKTKKNYVPLSDKMLWNEAVDATLKEVGKYDGLIPSEEDRKNLINSVKKRLLYKNL